MIHPVISIFGIDIKELVESISPYGEIVLAFIVFAETGLLIGFFLPGDSLLFTAGILAGQGDLDIVLVVVGCFVAAVLGDQVGYMFGHRIGPRLFTRPDSRFFKQENVERTREFFERHGPKAIVIARFVPIVRTFTPVMAGIGKMNHRVYTIYNFAGALLWAVGITLLGYALGDVIGDNIDAFIIPLVLVIVAVSLLPILLERRRSKKAATPADEAAEIHKALDPDS